VAYSFYPTKNLPVSRRRWGGLDQSRALPKGCGGFAMGDGAMTRWPARAPSISRLDEMQACYLRAFLPKLPEWNQHRARLADLYDRALAGCDGVRPWDGGQVRCAISTWCGPPARPVAEVPGGARRHDCRALPVPLPLAAGVPGLRPETRRPAGGGTSLPRGSVAALVAVYCRRRRWKKSPSGCHEFYSEA